MTKEEASKMLKFERVEYTPTKEIGHVSSVNDELVFVKFESQTNSVGWENTTAQGCRPEDLKDLNDSYTGWITDPKGRQQYPKNFAQGMGGFYPEDETLARMDYVKERMAIMKKRLR